MEQIKEIIARINQTFILVKPCILRTPVVVNVNKLIQVYNGHGDGLTR